MTSTHLKYMENQYLYEDKAIVVAVEPAADGRVSITLDQTIFYPQGGGQLCDQGLIQTDGGEIQIEDVRLVDGRVQHLGQLRGTLQAGDSARLTVDEARRTLHSRLHSAGHVIDEVVRDFGWQAFKACHFPGQGSVVCTGDMTDADYITTIETEANQRLEMGYDVQTHMIRKDQIPDFCHIAPAALPPEDLVRAVVVWGDKGGLCGGTHISNIQDIGRLFIRKVKNKKGEIRISYDIA